MTTRQIDTNFWGKLSTSGKKPGLRPILTAAQLDSELSSSDDNTSSHSSSQESQESEEDEEEAMDVIPSSTTETKTPTLTADGIPIKQPRLSKVPRTTDQQHHAQSEFYKSRISELLRAEEWMDERLAKLEARERKHRDRDGQHQRDFLLFEGWRQQHLPQPQLRPRSPVVDYFIAIMSQQQQRQPNGSDTLSEKTGDAITPLDVDHVTGLLACYQCQALLMKEALGQIKLVHGLVQFPRYPQQFAGQQQQHKPYAVIVATDCSNGAVIFYIVHAMSL